MNVHRPILTIRTACNSDVIGMKNIEIYNANDNYIVSIYQIKYCGVLAADIL